MVLTNPGQECLNKGFLEKLLSQWKISLYSPKKVPGAAIVPPDRPAARNWTSPGSAT